LKSFEKLARYSVVLRHALQSSFQREKVADLRISEYTRNCFRLRTENEYNQRSRRFFDNSTQANLNVYSLLLLIDLAKSTAFPPTLIISSDDSRILSNTSLSSQSHRFSMLYHSKIEHITLRVPRSGDVNVAPRVAH
jgi:hypothetical protein